ncbi:hypothetical protein [Candidatus Coxiella mudrowiae]|uniref:hypothetical protein n=1 Tax=Candidatus Coxiella mudrowiae TaxID=2054173 RepID=UPI0012FE8CDD|nr:hypothetical protein [Candidatus Coxiella mudrowiae]
MIKNEIPRFARDETYVTSSEEQPVELDWSALMPFTLPNLAASLNHFTACTGLR